MSCRSAIRKYIEVLLNAFRDDVIGVLTSEAAQFAKIDLRLLVEVMEIADMKLPMLGILLKLLRPRGGTFAPDLIERAIERNSERNNEIARQIIEKGVLTAKATRMLAEQMNGV
jgi:hypothetical protein